MKKIKYILLIFILLLTACKSNELKLDNFIDKATFNGYIVKEDKEGYEDISKITDVYYAINREYQYNIQFIKTNDIDYAKKFFLYNVTDIKNEIDNNSYVKSNSLSNYEYYHAENESNYYLVARNKENIIYISAPINYINEIEEFLTELDIDY